MLLNDVNKQVSGYLHLAWNKKEVTEEKRRVITVV